MHASRMQVIDDVADDPCEVRSIERGKEDSDIGRRRTAREHDLTSDPANAAGNFADAERH